MAYDTGFSRRSSSERELQPVAIVSVDPVTRTAIGVTRTRHSININCSYATGDTITTPAAGEQWYCERFDMEWRLYGRIPFNDETLNIKPEEGQVSVGSARGPLELNGPEVRVNGKVFRLNGVYYRDDGTALQRSTDQVNWSSISAGDMNNLVPLIASALTDYQGDDQDAALNALGEWGGLLQTVIDNFSAFWNEICQNVFVSGLKRIGFGDTDLAKIVDGFQNFIDYAFSIVFCDFDGNLTPQTFLARLRDLLAPITQNPFVLGLQQLADLLGVAAGNLLNDAVTGATEFIQILFGLITCDEDALAKVVTIVTGATGTGASPDNIIKFLATLLAPLIDNPFLQGLRDFAEAVGVEVTNLADGAILGATELIRTIFDLLLCQLDSPRLAAVSDVIETFTAGVFNPAAILKQLQDLVDLVTGNGLVQVISGLAASLGINGNLAEVLLGGVNNLFNWFFKVLKTVVFFVDWEALLPFIDWDAVDAVDLPDLGDLLINFNPLDIFGPLDDLIGGAFTNFVTNLNSFFSGMGLLDGTFNPATAIDYFLQNVLGLVDNAGKIITTFLPAITVETLTGLADWFRTNFLGGSQTLLAWFQATILGGAANLLAWLTANVFGNVNPATFFTNLANFLGFDLRTLSFNAFNAATAFLNKLFDPARGPLASVQAFIAQFFDPSKGPLSGIFFIIKAVADWFSIFMPQANTSAATSTTLTTTTVRDQLPSVTDLVTAITGLAETADTDLGMGTLNQWARDIELAATQGFDALSGTIEEIISGILSVGMLNTSEPNLLTQGDFASADTVESAGGWSWDNTVSATGGGGSARAVATGSQQQLYAKQSIKVKTDDKLIVTAKVQTSGFTAASGREMVLSIIPWVGSSRLKVNNLDYTHVVHTRTAAAATFQDMTGLTIKIGGTAAAGEVVLPSTVTSIQVRLAFTGNPGAIAWFDDVVVKKTGLVEQSWVQSLVDAFQATVGGLYGQGAPDTTADWTKLFAAAQQARGRADTANVNLGTTNNTLFGNTAGGTVFSNPAALIATLAGIRVDGSSTMATMISYLIDRLSAGTLSGSTADLIYWAAKKAADEAGFGFTRANYANQNLFGNPAGGNNGKVLATALPTSLGAVGSGIIMFQVNTISSADWGPSGGYGPNTAGFKYLSDGFYPNISASATDDLVYDNAGGRVGLRALRAGWYMIEVGFGLRSSVQYTYWWSFTPAIYESRTARVKYGSSVVSARDVNVLASFTLTPFNAQSSFIVYMNANDVVRPGYLAIQENNAGTGSAEILQSRNANFEGTYFSAALLNRSLL